MKQNKIITGFSAVPPLVPVAVPPPPPIPNPPTFSRESSFNLAQKYLKAIDPDNDIFDFRLIHPNSGVRNIRGTLNERHDYLYSANQNGSGIYATINETDGKGVKKNNIVKVRSVFLDFDNQKEGILEVIKHMTLKPSLIVNTSVGNYHVFWRVFNCPLNRFKEIQNQLIEKYSADKSVNDLPRIMRVAGFNNTKRDPNFLCRVIESTSEQYSIEQIISGFDLSNSGVTFTNTDKTTVSSVGTKMPFTPGKSAENRAYWTRDIINGVNLHDSVMKLITSNLSRSMTREQAVKDVQELMKKSKVFGTERWKQRFNDLGRIANDCENTINPFSSDFYDWPYVEPIVPTLKPVAPLDCCHLPVAFAAHIKDVSERMQCPPDFAAVGLFISIASVIGRKVRIYPKQKDDWLVVPNLWGMVIGRPSLMKTTALKGTIDILKRFEIEEKNKYEKALIDYDVEADFKKWDKNAKESEAKALHGIGDIDGAKRILASLKTLPDLPSRVRKIINDASVEKLGELLNENPNGFLMFRDELTGWLNMLDKEGSNDRPFYLEAWVGDGSYVYDRIGRGTIDIESTTLSLLGGIQPSKIKSYVREAMNGGSSDDGLIQRLQLAVYPDVKSKYNHVDRFPDKSAKQPLINKFTELNKWQPESNTLNAFGEPEPFALRFAVDAQKYFNDWFIKNEGICRDDLHPALESHFAKYRSLLPSIALIIELVDSGDVSGVKHVCLSSLQKAIGYVEYLRSHAYRIYGMAEKPEVDGANLIIKRLKKLENPFTARDIQRKGWSGLTDTGTVQKSLTLLEEHNYCRKHIINSPKGGTAKIQYYVNPMIISKS